MGVDWTFFLSFLPLFGDEPIQAEILSQRAVNPNNQPPITKVHSSVKEVRGVTFPFHARGLMIRYQVSLKNRERILVIEPTRFPD